VLTLKRTDDAGERGQEWGIVEAVGCEEWERNGGLEKTLLL